MLGVRRLVRSDELPLAWIAQDALERTAIGQTLGGRSSGVKRYIEAPDVGSVHRKATRIVAARQGLQLRRPPARVCLAAAAAAAVDGQR